MKQWKQLDRKLNDSKYSLENKHIKNKKIQWKCLTSTATTTVYLYEPFPYVFSHRFSRNSVETYTQEIQYNITFKIALLCLNQISV